MKTNLLGDLDDPLHSQARVAAAVLGVHEARLHIPAGLGGDRLLLKAAGRERPREADRFPADELFRLFSLPASRALTIFWALALLPSGRRGPCARHSLRFRSARARPHAAWSARGSRSRSSARSPAGAGSVAGAAAAVTVKLVRGHFADFSPSALTATYSPGCREVCASLFLPAGAIEPSKTIEPYLLTRFGSSPTLLDANSS